MSNLILPRRELVLPSSVRRKQGGFLLNPYRFATGDSDPYWSSVVLLMHMDGTNGSTTFTDEKGHTVTANGNAQISTAQSKFGGASALFDGTGDYLRLADSSDWTFAGDFTIEAWVRPANVTSAMAIASHWYSGTAIRCSWIFAQKSDGTFRFAYGIGGTNSEVASTTGLTANVWQHISAVRSGTTVTLYLDGVSVGSGTVSGALNDCPDGLGIGVESVDRGSGRYFNGYIDEIRISKGIARYTANFTAPSAAFPNQ
jgi:hypothetical protein